jgi:FAD/FMN-containing dehydrogenase/Fe-S oxidoreductase
VTSVEPRELAAALRRAGVAEADDTTRRRAEYSSDASNYRVVPAVVAFPRHVDEVLAAVGVAGRLGVPVTCRGGGTSIAGNAVGMGLVLDFSRHLHSVLDVDPAARTARVQPGAVLDSITAAAAPHGLRWGPDPSTHARATIGGSIGNNACGARALAYGKTADNVIELDIVTADGSRLTAAAGNASAPTRLHTELQALVGRHLQTIRTEFGRFARQVSGYSLEHLLPERGFDLAKFLSGTEGTLAVLLGATVRLVEAPLASALCVLGYRDLAHAADAAPALLPHRPIALEGMDVRLVDAVRNLRGDAAIPELPRGAAWLFAEVGGATDAEARAVAEKLIVDADAVDSTVVAGATARALWRIREDGAGLAGRTPAGAPAWPGWEDAAVPPERLGAYLRDFDTLLGEYGMDAIAYGHLGDGCVHARIDFPFGSAPDRFLRFVTDAAQLVGGYGGSISGEHGDGRARSELLRHMYSAEALAAFAEVKRLFDPRGLLNPGVVVQPDYVDANLRVPAAKAIRSNLGFAYSADGGDLSTAVHRCVGVGKCRADLTGAGGVMCPSYLATRDEKDSTRGRARVLQELANGSLLRGFDSPEIAESLELCLACKGCASDCPAGVDMATYKAEVLHQRYRRKLRPPAHYALGWLPRWARLASRAPSVANSLLRSPGASKAAKRIAGIDARRPLPAFAERSFRQWFGDHQPADGRPVLLFVDTFTDYFSPDVGIAAVRVLEAAGYQVQIPDRPVCCGLTWISTGQLDGARRQLRRTLDALAPALEGGLPVVGLEPSCTAVLRDDVRELLPADPRSRAVTHQTRTLAEQLVGTEGWAPPRLDGVAALAQPHCHHHAVMGWQTDAELLAAAGAHVKAVGGCCGLAGNFGVERGHYDVSRAVAETALLPAVRNAPHDAVVLADGFSCRTQLAQLANVEGIHLAQLLAARLAPLAPQRRDAPPTSPQEGHKS